MEDRLSKVIAQAGLASRRGADRLIEEGVVTVNGRVVLEPGFRVDVEKDHVKVEGKLIRQLAKKVYVLVNKPRGLVSEAKPGEAEFRPTLAPLLTVLKTPVVPIERLDWDAEGVVLFTNDGQLVKHLSDPEAGIPRTYLVKIRGVADDKLLRKLRSGVPLPDGRSLPLKVRVISSTGVNAWLQIVVREVKTHLLKRVFFKLGQPVLKLKRTAYANFTLQGLPVGAFRWLTPDEIKGLKELAEQPPGLADLREPSLEEDDEVEEYPALPEKLSER